MSDEILYLQHRLNSTGLINPALVEDGIWGLNTKSALDLVISKLSAVVAPVSHSVFAQTIAKIANSQVGVKEVGNNSGPQIVQYQTATWLAPGPWPWCAAFVDWVIQQAMTTCNVSSLKRPQTAGAYDLENWAIQNPTNVKLFKGTPDLISTGDIIVFTFGHCGLAVGDEAAGIFNTVEGNTNNDGGAEGDGVYTKLRKRALVRSFIRILV
jgi:hypothetical protein